MPPSVVTSNFAPEAEVLVSGTVVDSIFKLGGFLLNSVLPVILNNDLLLGGVVLLGIALVVEILNGLLDFVVYTALIGGVGLLGMGIFFAFF